MPPAELPLWWLPIAAGIQLTVLLVTLIECWLERRSLGAFVREIAEHSSARDEAGPRRSASRNLRAAIRDAGLELERGLKGSRSIDIALSEAIAKLSTSRLGAPLLLLLLADLVLIGLVLAPTSLALSQGAVSIAELWNVTRAMNEQRLYAISLEAIPPAFVAIRPAFTTSAILLGGALLVWAVRWWLLRPEARQLRAVHAFLRAARASRKELMLPISARMTNALTPSESLRPAVGAALGFAASGTAALLLLAWTSALRHDNRHTLRFGHWEDRVMSTGAVGDLEAPRHPAGGPLREGATPTMLIGRDAVQLGTARVAALTEGRLPANWRAGAERAQEVVDAFAAGNGNRSIAVVADRGTRASTLVELLQYLVDEYDATRFSLLINRPSGDPSKHLWAGFDLALGPPPGDPAATLVIEREAVRLQAPRAEEQVVSSTMLDWTATLRGRIQAATAVFERAAAAPPNLSVAVRLPEDLEYARITSILAAADGVCSETTDCDLPGLGLRFYLAN